MCDCYTVGGPWVAEDPNCPIHGTRAVEEEEYRQNEIRELQDRVEKLEHGMKLLADILADINPANQ